MANFRNSLSYNVPIVDELGRPTPEFMAKWQQQTQINKAIPAEISTPEQVSAILDLLAATPGALLRRGAAQWQALNSLGDATKFLNGAGAYAPPVPLDAKGQVLGTTGAALGALAPGVDSQVLTADATQLLGFKWAPAGGGGGGGRWPPFDPPHVSELSTVTGGATLFSLQDDPDVGLQAICKPSNGLDNCHIAYRTLSDKTKDWTLTVHFNFLIDTANWSGLGIMAMDSVSGRVEMVVFETRTTNARPIWRRMNSLTSFNTDPYTNSTWGPMGWMRWRKVTADAKLYFDMSPDGKTWHNYVAYAPNAWLTNLADRVGIGFYSHLTSQREFSCDYFSLTGPAV